MSQQIEQLREWIYRYGRIERGDELRDDTPLLAQGILSSLQVMDLILYLEEVRGRAIEAGELVAGSFRDLNTIAASFLTEGTS